MPLLYERNDITRIQADAIVNAANNTLLGGGGVDGAIHKAAGPELLQECKSLGGCLTGEAKITRGYRLPSQYVIHTVGPIWHGGDRGEEQLLRACYRNSLSLAVEYGCETVAFPLISAGVYGYPKEEALQVATETISSFLEEHDELTVTLVVFSKKEFQLSSRLYSEIRSLIDDEYAEKKLLYEDRRRRSTFDNISFAPSLAYSIADVLEDAIEGHGSDKTFPTELEEILAREDEGFKGMLIRKIGEMGMTDAQCYKKANIDRRHFNHLINDPMPKPKKKTVLAFALALKLSEKETEEMLSKAGFAFSPADKSDKIIRYCIEKGEYNINTVNQLLFDYDLPILGC